MLLACMSAPACRSHCTTAKRPSPAAIISAVRPTCAPESGQGTFYWRAGGGWIFVNKGHLAPCPQMEKPFSSALVVSFVFSGCFNPYLAYSLLSTADFFVSGLIGNIFLFQQFSFHLVTLLDNVSQRIGHSVCVLHISSIIFTFIFLCDAYACVSWCFFEVLHFFFGGGVLLLYCFSLICFLPGLFICAFPFSHAHIYLTHIRVARPYGSFRCKYPLLLLLF